MKTNAEILNKKLKERGKLNSSVWDWIETEDIEELMDKSRAEGKEEGRAEERKKVMPLTEKATLVSESYAKGYENGKKFMKGLYAETTPEKPKITRKQVESLKKIVKLVEQIDHNHNWYIMRGGLLPYDWTDYMGRNLFELAKEIKNIKAMGLEVEK